MCRQEFIIWLLRLQLFAAILTLMYYKDELFLIINILCFWLAALSSVYDTAP